MSVVDLLGGNGFIGVVIGVLACITLFTWDYIRLEPSGRWLAHTSTVRGIGIGLAIVSVILIGSRFVDVLSHHGIGVS
jgi:hypothetical protein